MATSSSRQPLVTSVAIKRPLSVGFKLVQLARSRCVISAGQWRIRVDGFAGIAA